MQKHGEEDTPDHPHGRHRSIDGVMHVHPDRCKQFTELETKYRIKLLEEYIDSLPVDQQ